MDDYAPHARFYDLEHADYQDDLALYAGFAEVARHLPHPRNRRDVLELACGSGRILLPLAAMGVSVTGLDTSPAMLALARQKAADAGNAALTRRVHLIEGDMRDFHLGRTFGLVIVGLNSLMHLQTQEEQLATLRAAARHLDPDGRLVVDLFNPEVALPDQHQEGQLFLHCLKTLPDGAHLLHYQSPRVDRAAQLIHMANYYDEILADATVKRHLAPFTLRYVTRGELQAMAAAAGLTLAALYGTYELDPYEADSPRLLAVLERPD
ncbi:MAG: hypothetical protein AVDCRST_MAG77-942 [uncultured Chloroflexi bacterium]|uniref:Methyltransferase domain-containing protein n=1 Tax=uncultured Chloroflexota bacterium TaxID=166587 RepID=A0A6J4HNN1_9CHLR|nr:MAG: hypothetical protein AVDCRST_MAG77-942 [uncultured Chloroflexota bacterium]